MTRDRQRLTEGVIALVLFGLTIPAANWVIGNAGTVCVPNGPCLVPVWPGIMAPSGVLMVGLGLFMATAGAMLTAFVAALGGWLSGS